MAGRRRLFSHMVNVWGVGDADDTEDAGVRSKWQERNELRGTGAQVRVGHRAHWARESDTVCIQLVN
jgi:hypothetical protein